MSHNTYCGRWNCFELIQMNFKLPHKDPHSAWVELKYTDDLICQVGQIEHGKLLEERTMALQGEGANKVTDNETYQRAEMSGS